MLLRIFRRFSLSLSQFSGPFLFDVPKREGEKHVLNANISAVLSPSSRLLTLIAVISEYAAKVSVYGSSFPMLYYVQRSRYKNAPYRPRQKELGYGPKTLLKLFRRTNFGT